jgi:hypothetical protein
MEFGFNLRMPREANAMHKHMPTVAGPQLRDQRLGRSDEQFSSAHLSLIRRNC